MLGGGLEPPRLTAYAPQTYVSAISPPELVQGREMINTTYRSRKVDFGRPTADLRSEALRSWIEGGPIPAPAPS